jgi:surfactin synthase thioesterase subunit
MATSVEHPSLVRWDAAGSAEVGLVCLPWAGAGAAPYAAWAGVLADITQVWAVRLPGRESRFVEPPVDDLNVLAEDIASQLERATSGPLVLFGLCFGGILAFEVAHRLHARGTRRVLRLIVASQVAPPYATADRSNTDIRAELAGLGLDDDLSVDEEMFELVRSAIEADARAVERYTSRERPPLPMPISAMVSTRDPIIDRAEVAAWSQETGAEFDLTALPWGDHLFTGNSWVRLACSVGGAIERTTHA